MKKDKREASIVVARRYRENKKRRKTRWKILSTVCQARLKVMTLHCSLVPRSCNVKKSWDDLWYEAIAITQ